MAFGFFWVFLRAALSWGLYSAILLVPFCWKPSLFFFVVALSFSFFLNLDAVSSSPLIPLCLSPRSITPHFAACRRPSSLISKHKSADGDAPSCFWRSYPPAQPLHGPSTTIAATAIWAVKSHVTYHVLSVSAQRLRWSHDPNTAYHDPLYVA